ncbi:hypothetical protein LguiA_013182 [Lonicera macranthoides]
MLSKLAASVIQFLDKILSKKYLTKSIGLASLTYAFGKDLIYAIIVVKSPNLLLPNINGEEEVISPLIQIRVGESLRSIRVRSAKLWPMYDQCAGGSKFGENE